MYGVPESTQCGPASLVDGHSTVSSFPSVVMRLPGTVGRQLAPFAEADIENTSMVRNTRVRIVGPDTGSWPLAATCAIMAAIS